MPGAQTLKCCAHIPPHSSPAVKQPIEPALIDRRIVAMVRWRSDCDDRVLLVRAWRTCIACPNEHMISNGPNVQSQATTNYGANCGCFTRQQKHADDDADDMEFNWNIWRVDRSGVAPAYRC